MNKKIVSIITACTIVVSFAGCGKKKEKAPTEPATNVTVYEADYADIDTTVDYTGEIKAGDTSSVSAMVSAEIKEIKVEVGDYVNAGDVLMTLDSTQYQHAYDQALAAYNQAQAGYNQALVGVTQAESAVTQANAAYSQAEASYTQAKAAYTQAQASKDTTVAAKDSAQASYNNVTGGSLEQTKLNVNQAVETAQSAYNTALSNYNRQKSLYDIGAVSQVALDTAKTNLDNAELALNTAKANAQITVDVVVPQTAASAQAGVDQAQAGITQADAGIEQANAGMIQANAGVEQARAGITQAQASVEQAQAGVTQAQAGIQQAKVAVDVANTNLSNCVVTAPISGYITAKNVTLGQMASPGYEIFQIKNAKMIDVEINVTESVISSVSTGTKAIINIDSAKIKNVEGVVTSVGATKNDVTGLFSVKVAIPNKKGKIKVGMIAEVSLVTQSVSKALAVDYNSILKDGDINYVYVENDGKAVRKDVVTGVTDGKKIEILSGLEKGENVIVDGKEFLSEENNKVRVVK